MPRLPRRLRHGLPRGASLWEQQCWLLGRPLTNGCALQSERSLQSSLLRTSLVNHLRRRPESVLVIEEYDKMDCDSRNLLRQLLDKGIAANVTASRSIIILEANTGSPHLIKLLQSAGSRDRLSPELTQRSLKDIVYNKWIAESCGVRLCSCTAATASAADNCATRRMRWTRRRC